MKIAYIDLRLPIGHKEQNSYYINTIAALGHEIYVFCPEGWYNDYSLKENVHLVSIPFQSTTNSYIGIKNIIELVRRESIILRRTKKMGIDKYFVASFEGVSYCFFDFMTPQKNKCLLYHDNIDALDNNIRLICYKIYRRNNTHVVFQPYMRERLLSLSKRKQDVKILHHELNLKRSTGKILDNMPEVIALSNTNSEDIIRDMVILDQKFFFSDCDFKILIKSKEIVYRGNNIVVINEFLNKEVYDDYFMNCRVVFMPFGRSNKYRESGTVIDALSNGKNVVSTKILITDFYKKKYPENIYIYNDYEELKSVLKVAIHNCSINCSFLETHSYSSIMKDLEEIISGRKEH